MHLGRLMRGQQHAAVLLGSPLGVALGRSSCDLDGFVILVADADVPVLCRSKKKGCQC